MAKFTLYKIIYSKIENLKKKLNEVGLEKINTKNKEDYTFDFYFSKEPADSHIWWYKLYKSFFPSNYKEPKNLNYFAVLLITNDKSKISYAVSLGKSFFYMKNYCDLDFGLNLAERIIDESNVKIKHARFYKSRRNKLIISYQDNVELEYNSGESTHYIKAKTINEQKWGKSASFGHSVLFNLDKNPLELADLIEDIETELKNTPKIHLPKIELIKDEEKQKELDKMLSDKILGKKSGVSTEEFSLFGVNIVFQDNFQYCIYLKGKRPDDINKKEMLTIDDLINYIESNNISLYEKLNELKVKVYNEHGKNFTRPLKEFLEFVDENERYCLIDGKWYQFNESYLKYLKQEVDKIEISKYEPQFDISRREKEEDFNKNRKKDGYINLDKTFTKLEKYKIEKLDLYKDNSLFFVKKGTAQKLGYVIDQAVNTIKLLQNNESKIKIDDEEKNINNIVLWLIYNKKKRINKLSEINSLIFQMKLVDFKQSALDAGFTPIVKINYIKD